MSLVLITILIIAFNSCDSNEMNSYYETHKPLLIGINYNCQWKRLFCSNCFSPDRESPGQDSTAHWGHGFAQQLCTRVDAFGDNSAHG